MPMPDARDYSLSRADLLTEGYKGLLAVHGGAITAMLALSSQLIGKSAPLLHAVFAATVVFSIGLGLALLIPYFRYYNSKAAENRDAASGSTSPGIQKTPSWWAYWSCQLASVAAFLVGTCTVALAGYTASPSLGLVMQTACK